MRYGIETDHMPSISIVMAAFNEEQGISKALDSIVAQSFEDWELIVIDDGSTDSTTDVVQQYVDADKRIRLICNETNMELSASLNKGIELARADLIARADADDVNLPDRLLKQYTYMQEHPEIDVLGTGAYLLDTDGQRVSEFLHPLTHVELEKLSFLKVPFFHPSVMIRQRFFNQVGLYDPAYAYAEDKEIWLRGMDAGCQYANLQEPLIEYSTGGFVKSWRYIGKHAGSLLRIIKRHNIRRGYISIFAYVAYNIAIKLGLYRPRSIRS